ncbi:MAG: phenylalanine--tRNA ligase subunit beta [Gemmatimonadetes bacterium]|nr:phenylalanine--tRNA ligase subunit beta [Gemmatimonadota bacterium]
MNISYRWLRALAPELRDSPQEVADRLTMYGAPVDEIVRLGEGLGDILIARVESVRRHPNADRLTLCEVSAGGEVVRVVCGAPNVRAGAWYPYVPAGGVLPNGVRIQQTRIRGEESNGMLCSEAELGLGRDQGGILELHGTFEPGERFVEALALDDHRFVVDVTPNRPDLLSHVGIARELAHGGVAGVTLPPFPAGAQARRASRRRGGAPAFAIAAADTIGEVDGVSVRIDDADLCPRYMAAVIRGVQVALSPEWLAGRLRAVGARPINNVVDATNYVLSELGQPLHAFDLDRLAGPAIVVRRARAGEGLTTLDGQARKLEPDMLAICDAERPVAVAGVMGGSESEVSSTTTNVLIECALFDPKSVRRTRKALDLSTDASYRFERGVDPTGLPMALRRVVHLIVTVAGGKTTAAATDVCPRPASPVVIDLRPQRVAQVLGIECNASSVRAQLKPLGFQVKPGRRGFLRVTVPGWRSYDVTREVDLIEEVARRYGYDRFPADLRPYRPGTVSDDPSFQREEELRSELVACGLLEARTAALVPGRAGLVPLANPLSAEEGHLRDALLPGLLRRIEHNFGRGLRDVRLFEIGTIFRPGAAGGQPVEATHLAIVLTGLRAPAHWSGPGETIDLWDVRALLEQVLAPAHFYGAELHPWAGDHVYFDRDLALSVQVSGHVIGEGGRVRREAVDAPPWAGPVWGSELTLPDPPPPPRIVKFEPLPAFPAVERDLALVTPDAVAAVRVERAIRAAGGEFLDHVAIFDVYRGPGIPERTRSLAFRLRFRAPDRTLRDEDADRATGAIVSHLREELGVEPRAR